MSLMMNNIIRLHNVITRSRKKVLSENLLKAHDCFLGVDRMNKIASLYRDIQIYLHFLLHTAATEGM